MSSVRSRILADYGQWSSADDNVVTETLGRPACER
jgi:hypothetical protein